MKKILSLILVCAMLVCSVALFASCDTEKIIVHTNAFFAPFEYYEGTEIKGVDVEIMNLVGKKLGKKIEFQNVEFSAIIDNVKEGKVCDAGAAGITITDERKEKVDFSTPYYTSVQYVIFKADDATVATKTVDGVEYIVWEALAGKKIGTQTDTTGWIYTDGEINATEDNDYGYNGVLYGTGTELKNYDNAQLAADAITANAIDVVIIDELPAQYIVSKNSGFKCLPLYYSGETDAEDAPVEEQYAICVTKGNTELLEAINEVLEELMVVGENGKTKIEEMVMAHMGME
ncbi:MAG: transporter substrate-binding domain-containing protein [Clostridia bacterium]|nr:transporter substrate-binding domain-containing protein [Clostridia bacterium]MBR2908672.1 transporter substrate-binding domain-containing protein [Clostridia bacterium]